MSEWSISPIAEMDNVFGDVLTSEHFKGHQLILHISDVIVEAKVGIEFLDEFFPVIKPGWLCMELSRESRFKPLEGLPTEVG
jgi:hypothetical protein